VVTRVGDHCGLVRDGLREGCFAGYQRLDTVLLLATCVETSMETSASTGREQDQAGS